MGRGQFYLMSIIVILAIIAGFFSVSNYSKSNIQKIMNKEEYNVESSNIIGYGISNNMSVSEINLLLGEFTEKYVEIIPQEVIIVFVFGDNQNMKKNKYSKGSFPIIEDLVPSDKIEFMENNESYEFDLTEGYNFHYVVIQRIHGEQFISVK